MVRNYKRKTNHGQDRNWSSSALIAAINEVQEGSKRASEASQAYDIPEATLRRYLKKKNPDHYPVHGGRFRQVFSNTLEEELCNYSIEMSARGFGMTRQQLCTFAFELAEKNQIQHNFDQRQKKAGVDWLAGFLRRHPNLSVRSPQATSLGRMMGFNRPQVNRFFDVLFEVMQKYKFSPSRIYNCDESGLPTVPTKLPKVLAGRGAKRVPKVTSAERGKNITLVCSMSASGSYIPPAFIYPRKRMRDELLIGAPTEAIGIAHKTGWMTAEVFVKYLQHVAKHSRPSKDDPILMIVDNHASHVSLSAIDFCRDSGIVMVSLPPHSTHRMQPLDVSFFGPLKTHYSRACDAWMTSHPGMAITEFYVASIVSEPYQKAATVAAAVNGFRSSGIYPLNRDVFTDADFCAAITTERAENHTSCLTVPSVKTESVVSVVSDASSVYASIVDDVILARSAEGSSSILPNIPIDKTESVVSVVSDASSFYASIVDDVILARSAVESALVVPVVGGRPSSVPHADGTSSVSCFDDGFSVIGSTPVPSTSGPIDAQSLSRTVQVLSGTIEVPPASRNEEATPSNETDNRPKKDGTNEPLALVGTPSSASHRTYVSPQLIRPYPTAARSATSRKRTAVRAQIITASPYKNELVAKKMAKDSIQEKKDARKKLKLTVQEKRPMEKVKKSAAEKSKQKNKQVRGDKPTNRKQPLKMKPKKRTDPQKSKISDAANETCPACGEVGGAEEWVRCGQCQTWWHEACSAYEGRGGFVCDFC